MTTVITHTRFVHVYKQHWQHHIDAWQQTQISQAQYCRSHQLDQSQFSYWKRKVLGASNTSTVSSQFTIAQVETSTLSVTLPNGVLIDGVDEMNTHVALKLLERLN
ncbi:IS66 family insertion sequence element accessory protein TnpB [Vibrio sp. CyArs1]|uniref:IS66 family insertion sequence element accessory protein TnpA n=1 Tax=Vibrio sp. CyArs1 TaxID=2682577 RepID=UPI001F068E63|nr:IS66 family insertion sequence element accessory protein TnpB [Vibrio sp. CyArs1]